jgi:hypothetical protein
MQIQLTRRYRHGCVWILTNTAWPLPAPANKHAPENKHAPTKNHIVTSRWRTTAKSRVFQNQKLHG